MNSATTSRHACIACPHRCPISCLCQLKWAAHLGLCPERILLLAKQCIREGRGSSRLLLYAHPGDAAYLRQQMDQLNPDELVELQIQSDPDLMQGDLRVETDVGTIDARIGTQLANLAAKIRESFRV